MSGHERETSSRLAGGGAGDCTTGSATLGRALRGLADGYGEAVRFDLDLDLCNESFANLRAQVDALRDAPIPPAWPPIPIHPSDLPALLVLMGEEVRRG